MSRIRHCLAGAFLAASTLLAASSCQSPAEGGHGIAVSDANARGCEVLLTEGTAKVDKVTFDDSLVGTFVRESPRVAVSFVAAKDAPISQGSVRISVTGDAQQVQVKKVTCVDAKGAPLSGATVTLE